MSEFNYSPMFPLTEDKTEYIKISDSFVKSSKINNTEILTIDPKALTLLSQRAFKDVSHLLRKSHLQQLRNTLDDTLPETVRLNNWAKLITRHPEEWHNFQMDLIDLFFL